EAMPVCFQECPLSAADFVVVGSKGKRAVGVLNLSFASLSVHFQTNALDGRVSSERCLVSPAVITDRNAVRRREPWLVDYGCHIAIKNHSSSLVAEERIWLATLRETARVQGAPQDAIGTWRVDAHANVTRYTDGTALLIN